MANSADPDQLASSDLDLYCLQRQGISGFSMTRVNEVLIEKYWNSSNLHKNVCRGSINKKPLHEVLLMSTRNTCFCGAITKKKIAYTLSYLDLFIIH